jgi:hypothetical protein
MSFFMIWFLVVGCDAAAVVRCRAKLNAEGASPGARISFENLRRPCVRGVMADVRARRADFHRASFPHLRCLPLDRFLLLRGKPRAESFRPLRENSVFKMYPIQARRRNEKRPDSSPIATRFQYAY